MGVFGTRGGHKDQLASSTFFFFFFFLAMEVLVMKPTPDRRRSSLFFPDQKRVQPAPSSVRESSSAKCTSPGVPSFAEDDLQSPAWCECSSVLLRDLLSPSFVRCLFVCLFLCVCFFFVLFCFFVFFVF